MTEKALPYDAEIEYLQSSGTQWIGTGIVPDYSTSVEVKCAILQASDCHVISARTGTGNNNRFFVFSYRTTTDIRSMLGNSYYYYGNLYGETPHVILFNKYNTHELFLDGNSIKTFSSGYSVSAQQQLTMYGTSGYGSDCSGIGNARIWYLKIEVGGVLVRDYIPVRIGQVGYMYDRVSGELFGNDGTGSFTLGPDKN